MLRLEDESDEEGIPPSGTAPPRSVSTPAAIALLADLYGQAEQQGLTTFSVATHWVLQSAYERVPKHEVVMIPVKLLHGLFLAVGPRVPMRMVWRQRGPPSGT